MTVEAMDVADNAPGAKELLDSVRHSLRVQSRVAIRAAAKPAVLPSPPGFVSLPTALKEAVVPVQEKAASNPSGRPGFYAAFCFACALVGIAAVWTANRVFAPEMYDDRGMNAAVKALSAGQNYAVFDLNLNIRQLRDKTFAEMKETPEVIVLGASHYQEAHAGVVRSRKMYNAHIHRDYWEDLLGMIGILVRHDKLPKQLIISIRDKQFTPLEDRTDFLWEPGIPFYREMADKLGVPKQSYWKTLPWQRVRERLSLHMLFTNVTRWYNAPAKPYPTSENQLNTLDLLLPDGSIVWSREHLALFTAERTERMSLDFAQQSKAKPPKIDPKGVASFRTALAFLKEKGVEVYFVHPPFNPTFYDAVRGSDYERGLNKVEQLTQDLAAEFGWKVFGSFDPADVGCEASDYIDAEHANASCLGKVFAQFDEFNHPDNLRGPQGTN
jgi:hypothetical protein